MSGREDYEERRQARIDRLNAASSKAYGEAAGAFQHSHDLVKDIPFGQPNIVGRSALPKLREKSWNTLGRAVELDKKGDYYADRATAAKNNRAISSDDPDAIDKLLEKVAQLEAERDRVKAANKEARKNGTEQAPWYTLPYIGKKIKDAKTRIAKLEQVDAMPALTVPFEGGEIESDPETNRVIIRFKETQRSEMRSVLDKSGFIWAPSSNGFQRRRTPYALRLAYRICGMKQEPV